MDKFIQWSMISLFFTGGMAVDGALVVSVDQRTANQNLLEAVAQGDLSLVKKYITSAQVDYRDESDNTALHNACTLGHGDIVRFLIARGANVNIVTTQGTPVGAAARSGHADIIQILVDYDADVNKSWDTRYHAENPILIAVERGDTRCVRALLNAGALTNKYQHGLLHLAITNAQFKDNKENYIRIIRLLIESGADLGYREDFHASVGSIEEDVTPLHLALLEGQFDIAKILPKVSSSPNRQVSDSDLADVYCRETPLSAALSYRNDCLCENLEIIKLLLESGAEAQTRGGALRHAMLLLANSRPIEKTDLLLRLSYLLYPSVKLSHVRIHWAIRALLQIFPPYVVVEILCSERSLLQDVINFFLIELKEGHMGSFLLPEMRNDTKELKLFWILFFHVKPHLINYLEKNALKMMNSCWHELDDITQWNGYEDDREEPVKAAAIKAQLGLLRDNLKNIISQGIDARCKELSDKARAQLALKSPLGALSTSASATCNKRAKMNSTEELL